MFTNKDIIHKHKDKLLKMKQLFGEDAFNALPSLVFKIIGTSLEYGFDQNKIKDLFFEGLQKQDFYLLGRAMCDFLVQKFPRSKSAQFASERLERIKQKFGNIRSTDLQDLPFEERPDMIKDLDNLDMEFSDIFSYLENEDKFQKSRTNTTVGEDQIIDFHKKAEERHNTDLQKAEEIKHNLLSD